MRQLNSDRGRYRRFTYMSIYRKKCNYFLASSVIFYFPRIHCDTCTYRLLSRVPRLIIVSSSIFLAPSGYRRTILHSWHRYRCSKGWINGVSLFLPGRWPSGMKTERQNVASASREIESPRWRIARKNQIVDGTIQKGGSCQETLVLFPVCFFPRPLPTERPRLKRFHCFLRSRGNFVGTIESFERSIGRERFSRERRVKSSGGIDAWSLLDFCADSLQRVVWNLPCIIPAPRE